jgi:putative transposase
MVSPLEALPITRQCSLLGITRSNFYYEPRGESEENLHLMKLMDRFHLEHPEWGRPKMTHNLLRIGYPVNPKRIGRLMQLMNIHSVLPGPMTSKPNEAHEIYPYLLRGLEIKAPKQVWSIDITYIPMLRGFLYLVAIIDWYSRYVLAWELSNTIGLAFCIKALESAFGYGLPEIFNSDQGSQFTSKNFTGILKEQQVRISMDGKGRALDNVFVERLWWSVKYEKIYLHAYQNGKELFEGLDDYFDYYNHRRLHSALDYKTPNEVYFGC